MTMHENIAPTMLRLKHCAERANTTAPKRLYAEDGGPSREIMAFCREYGFTLDYIYTGEGPKRRPGVQTLSDLPQDAYGRAARIASLMRAGQCAEDTALKMKHKGLGTLFETAEDLLNDLMADIEQLEHFAQASPAYGTKDSAERATKGGEY